MIFLENTQKDWSTQMRKDWLQGCGGGGRTVNQFSNLPTNGPFALYGIQPNTMHQWIELRTRRCDYYYIDNGYFSAGHADDKYMRVTKNGLQVSGYGVSNCERLKAHNVEVKPWRRTGRHILITCQTEWWYVQHGTCLQHWLDRIVEEIRIFSDRPIRVRLKPKVRYKSPPNTQLAGEITASSGQVPFLEDLKDAWCAVCHSSNTAVEAILEGVPAFVLGQCAAQPFALNDLKHIEHPFYPKVDRWNWAGVLADNQWTPVEIRQGKCWRDLQQREREEDGSTTIPTTS